MFELLENGFMKALYGQNIECAYINVILQT